MMLVCVMFPGIRKVKMKNNPPQKEWEERWNAVMQRDLEEVPKDNKRPILEQVEIDESRALYEYGKNNKGVL